MQHTQAARPAKRRWRSAILAALALVVASLTVMVSETPPAQAVQTVQTVQPNFQMPFPCGEVWRASTYPNHGAIDWNYYPDDNGRTVVASAAGTASLYYESVGGYYVIIDHGDGWQTIYAHLQQNGRVSGPVQAGDPIGYVGATGSSPSAPHLHWEQKLNGVKQSTLYANGVALSPGTAYDQTAPAYTSANCGVTPPGGSKSNLIQNAGFNVDTSHWSTTGAANIATYASNSGTNPYEGTRFGATNGSQAGDSMWQERAFSTGPGDTVCASSELTTIGGSGGASGVLAVWLLGTTTAESSTFTYTNIPGNNVWTPIKACVRASSTHATVKVQFYPTPGAPTVAVDAVDLHQSTILNGGFNVDTSHWSAHGSANMTTYASVGTTLPYEGNRFGASNASQAGDSISEEIAAPTGPGDTFCAEARVVTAGGTTGASGTFAVWLTDVNAAEVSTFSYGGLAGGSSWTPIKACVTATSTHANVKVQFYPTPGAPTVAIDAVDVHKSVIQNGGFNVDASHWSATGTANMAVYGSLSGTAPYEGTRFVATNASQAGDSISEEIAAPTGPGDTFCAEVRVSTIGSGGAGTFAVWLTGSTAAEVSTYVFSGLPGGNVWTPIKTCVTATSSHDNVKVQFYPAVNGPTMAIDAVDVH